MCTVVIQFTVKFRMSRLFCFACKRHEHFPARTAKSDPFSQVPACERAQTDTGREKRQCKKSSRPDHFKNRKSSNTRATNSIKNACTHARFQFSPKFQCQYFIRQRRTGPLAIKNSLGGGRAPHLGESLDCECGPCDSPPIHPSHEFSAEP